MNYLLDTDIIISHLHNKLDLNINFSQGIGFSAITYGEVLYGIEKVRNSKKAKQFVDFIQEYDLEILPVTEIVVKRYVSLKIFLEKSGQKLDEFDLLIAATAMEHDLTLVTANKSHFSRISGLKLA